MAAQKKKQTKKNSPFENACAELKEASTGDEKEQKDNQIIRDTTKSWPKYKNPNKGCEAGSRVIKPYHCSSTIREKLVNFIPNDCSLHYCCFSKGLNCCPGFNYNINEFDCTYCESLSVAFAAVAKCDPNAAHLKNVIGTKQFDFTVNLECNGNSQKLFIKMIGPSAYVSACGTSKRTDCMTFAPKFAIKLNENALVVLRAKRGLLGCGFCNLIADPRRKTQRKKVIQGNSMIMIREDNMKDIDVLFYAKNGISHFGMSMESENLAKNNYENPLCLFLQSNEGRASADYSLTSPLANNQQIAYGQIVPRPLSTYTYSSQSYQNTSSCRWKPY